MSTATATPAPTRVRKGMTFRSVHGDSNALWEVIGSAGRGVWHCVIVNEPMEINGKVYDGDYAGVTDVFTSDRILTAVRSDLLFADLARRDKEEADAFPAGTAVHGEAGRNRWIRGTVVDTPDGKKIRCEALVGDWQPHELPRRHADGSVGQGGFHAKAVATGDLRPLAPRTIYESGSDRYADWPAPTAMDPVDLTVPPMTAEEEVRAAKVRRCIAIGTAVRDAQSADFDVDAALAKVAAIVAGTDA
ncbi:hypothetical protein DVS28_b0104 (plasmid) [Euzebya pacifica]|uniref:Uncharacterized protein n=1 Tax=Euzebya pacifica TaxID=1608957 RepID=A0A346Y5X7_9ACTN|nr:hypothetical protein [Euzebya pacifica]AXV09874.1 hypothetical protein DVS28_b0104 [Euzebya pacifica]